MTGQIGRAQSSATPVNAPATSPGTAVTPQNAAAPANPAAAPTAAPVAAPPQDPLLVQIDEAIRVNSQRYLVANHNSPWQIFHGVLAYRQDFLLKVGDKKIPAIEWIAQHEPRFDNRPLLLKTSHGAKFHPFTRAYAFEGHPAQSLALLSESHLPADFPIKIGNQTVTIADIIQNTMMEVNTNEEITWVLWALSNYLKTDATWVNQHGQAWSIEQLVAWQVRARVEDGACGGNHGLFALVRARDKYLKSGRPLRGVWLEADQKIQRYIEIARALQNTDGSFSSEFYEGRGYSKDMNARFNTSGHTFEFISSALPDSRLNEPWVRSAAHMLSNELIWHRRAQPDCGPLYHSINSLINYRARLRPASEAALATTRPVTQAAPTAVAEAPMPTTPEAKPTTPQTTSPAAPNMNVPPLTPIVVAPGTTPAVVQPQPRVTTPLPTVVDDVGKESEPVSALRPINTAPLQTPVANENPLVPAGNPSPNPMGSTPALTIPTSAKPENSAPPARLPLIGPAARPITKEPAADVVPSTENLPVPLSRLLELSPGSTVLTVDHVPAARPSALLSDSETKLTPRILANDPEAAPLTIPSSALSPMNR